MRTRSTAWSAGSTSTRAKPPSSGPTEPDSRWLPASASRSGKSLPSPLPRSFLIDRRAFLAGAFGLLAAPFAADAQARKMPWVGVLGCTSSYPVLAQVFSKGLGDAGYVDGRNVSIEHRHAGSQPDRLPGLALELVRARADVIFARGAGA